MALTVSMPLDVASSDQRMNDFAIEMNVHLLQPFRKNPNGRSIRQFLLHSMESIRTINRTEIDFNLRRFYNIFSTFIQRTVEKKCIYKLKLLAHHEFTGNVSFLWWQCHQSCCHVFECVYFNWATAKEFQMTTSFYKRKMFHSHRPFFDFDTMW